MQEKAPFYRFFITQNKFEKTSTRKYPNSAYAIVEPPAIIIDTCIGKEKQKEVDRFLEEVRAYADDRNIRKNPYLYGQDFKIEFNIDENCTKEKIDLGKLGIFGDIPKRVDIHSNTSDINLPSKMVNEYDAITVDSTSPITNLFDGEVKLYNLELNSDEVDLSFTKNVSFVGTDPSITRIDHAYKSGIITRTPIDLWLNRDLADGSKLVKIPSNLQNTNYLSIRSDEVEFLYPEKMVSANELQRFDCHGNACDPLLSKLTDDSLASIIRIEKDRNKSVYDFTGKLQNLKSVKGFTIPDLRGLDKDSFVRVVRNTYFAQWDDAFGTGTQHPIPREVHDELNDMLRPCWHGISPYREWDQKSDDACNSVYDFLNRSVEDIQDDFENNVPLTKTDIYFLTEFDPTFKKNYEDKLKKQEEERIDNLNRHLQKLVNNLRENPLLDDDEVKINNYEVELIKCYPFLNTLELCATYNITRDAQKLIMNKIEGNEVKESSYIHCIHTAICNISVDEFEEIKENTEELQKIISSEGRREEIDLSPIEHFIAFKSWVEGLSLAGMDAFTIQDEMDILTGNPIYESLMSFSVQYETGLLDEYLSHIQNSCVFDGEPHDSCLIANVEKLMDIFHDDPVKSDKILSIAPKTYEYKIEEE
jgi:hypothetical protein